jgi:hypothetical protein
VGPSAYILCSGMLGGLWIANGLQVIDLYHSCDSIPLFTADTKENCILKSEEYENRKQITDVLYAFCK